MANHEWRVSLIQGRQNITITQFGFRFGRASYKWSDLTVVRTYEIGARGRGECLVLSLGDKMLDLEATGTDREFAAWTAMLADFAGQLAVQRPEMEVILSPSDSDRRAAFWFSAGFIVIGVLLTAVLLSASGLWIGAFAGVMPALVGIVGCIVYRSGRPEKRISAKAFATQTAM